MEDTVAWLRDRPYYDGQVQLHQQRSGRTATFQDVDSRLASVLKRYAEIPPRVEYDLTAEGEELCELLEPLLRWVEKRNASGQ